MDIPTWWYLFQLGFTTFISISLVLGNILNQNRLMIEQYLLLHIPFICIPQPFHQPEIRYQKCLQSLEGGLNWAHKIIKQCINFEIIQETTHQPQRRLCISVEISLSLLPSSQSFHLPSLNCCPRGWPNLGCLIHITAKHRNRRNGK